MFISDFHPRTKESQFTNCKRINARATPIKSEGRLAAAPAHMGPNTSPRYDINLRKP